MATWYALVPPIERFEIAMSDFGGDTAGLMARESELVQRDMVGIMETLAARIAAATGGEGTIACDLERGFFRIDLPSAGRNLQALKESVEGEIRHHVRELRSEAELRALSDASGLRPFGLSP